MTSLPLFFAIRPSVRQLARISHQWFAAAPDTSASTVLRSVGLLDVLLKYASVALPSRAQHGPPRAMPIHALAVSVSYRATRWPGGLRDDNL